MMIGLWSPELLQDICGSQRQGVFYKDSLIWNKPLWLTNIFINWLWTLYFMYDDESLGLTWSKWLKWISIQTFIEKQHAAAACRWFATMLKFSMYMCYHKHLVNNLVVIKSKAARCTWLWRHKKSHCTLLRKVRREPHNNKKGAVVDLTTYCGIPKLNFYFFYLQIH